MATTKTQSRIDRFNVGVSISQIAEQDGCSFKAILDCLRLAGAVPNTYLVDEYLRALLRQGEEVPAREYHFVELDGRDLPESWFRTANGKLRKWATDCAWPDLKLAVEIDGLSFVKGGGAHNKDREKRNAYALLGWMVLYFDSDMLEDPDLCATITVQAIQMRRAEIKEKRREDGHGDICTDIYADL